ncbi:MULTISPECIES: DNA polymerase III subunit delta [Micrococcaceae]|uniref:DNA polymerase III subunit delta n=1 Tax=Micrococcaceae TaxID=1268 RepID=UPI000CFC4E0E|nr:MULTISPECIES: DNA polymerase III subunit delta [unclassified Arthrobacter]MCS3491810.1 DNA polymerase-3 subunit delta [Arthrobacter sp. JUb119]PQZ86053.1 DNA polymerase III subunit delta [Arthrobacter sp. MYb222]PRB78189.1 DNA polymerase III subunit delta [Arthrobacter sp. MYb214]
MARAQANPGISWRELRPQPLILLTGSEDYLASRAFELLRSQASQRDDIQHTRLDAAKYEPGELLMATSSSLFSSANLVEVHELAHMNEYFLKDALAYLKDQAPENVLIMHYSGGTRGKKLIDAIKAAGALIVNCQPVKKDSEKIDFVQSEFKAAKRRITNDAVKALVAAVGNSLAELGSSCSQLIADTTGTIDQDTVDRYYGGRVEATAFKVADAAISGNAQMALRTLRHALGTGTDPIPIVATLAMKVRQIAKVAGVNEPAASLASELGMAPWQVQQAQQQARGWKRSDLALCVEEIANTDRMVKGGSRSPGYALEHAIMFIAGKAPGR